MRLWSIRLDWLDKTGLIALWRESLLAKAVLSDRTKGYRNHPQLIKFKSSARPQAAINTYLKYIYEEAARRGFSFNSEKISWRYVDGNIMLKITQGQLDYELSLLMMKLRLRSIEDYKRIADIILGEPNQLFVVQEGKVEPWERVKKIEP